MPISRNEREAASAVSRLDSIPHELRERDQWVCWNYEMREGKSTKVPCTVSRASASSTDPATWTSFADVVPISSTEAVAGIGYVFTADDPYTGIDFDSCLDDGKLHPEVAALVATLDSYTEVSPSGTGIKVIVRASKNGFERCRTGKTAWGGEFEVYDVDRYFTITGNVLSGTPATIEDRQSQLVTVLERVFGKPKPPPVHVAPATGGFKGDDQDLIERACRAKNGAKFERLWNGDVSGHNDDDSAADMALCGLLAFWTGCDPDWIDSLFRQSGLMRDKWLRDDYRERTITKAIDECGDVYQGGEVIDLTEYIERVNAARIAEGGAIDLASLLDDTEAFFRRHVLVADPEAWAIVLWQAHTYVYDTARATPYLHFLSPDPGSGKTTALEVSEVVARAGMTADDLTGPALFRVIDKRRPTLLIDEVDGIFAKRHSDSAEDLRKVLNSGYKKDKRVLRIGGHSHEIQEFDVYCPKALAGLKELPGTLAHRAIPIAMKPPRPDEHWIDFDPDEVEQEALALRVRFEAWAQEAWDALRDPERKPAKLPELDARRNEIWRILFRIADLARGAWPQRARLAALALSSGDRRSDEASIGIQLLADIRVVFEDVRITCQALVDALNALEEKQWGGWSDATGIKTRELGRKLKPYGIVAKPIRIDGERVGNGYEREQFLDAWLRYLPVHALGTGTTGTSGSQSQIQAFEEPVQDAFVPVIEEGANPDEYRDVPVVPVPAPIGEDAILDEVRELVDAGIVEEPSSPGYWVCRCGEESKPGTTTTPVETRVSAREPTCPFCGRKRKARVQ
jgi:putative DNA primase/helicase